MGTSPAIHLWTVRQRNDVATTLPLEVFTQRNFVADFYRENLNFTGITAKSKGGWVTLGANFRGKGASPPMNFGVRKLESWTITWRCLRHPTFSRLSTRLLANLSDIIRTAGRTDGRTDGAIVPRGQIDQIYDRSICPKK